MTAHDTVDGAGGVRTLADVASAFLDRHGIMVTEPDLARERCVEMSEAFARACITAGIPAQVISGAKFGETPEFPGVRLLLHGHSATVVADGDIDLVYDWTARQFDPDAPVPLIMPLGEWREEWVHPDHW